MSSKSVTNFIESALKNCLLILLSFLLAIPSTNLNAREAAEGIDNFSRQAVSDTREDFDDGNQFDATKINFEEFDEETIAKFRETALKELDKYRLPNQEKWEPSHLTKLQITTLLKRLNYTWRRKKETLSKLAFDASLKNNHIRVKSSFGEAKVTTIDDIPVARIIINDGHPETLAVLIVDTKKIRLDSAHLAKYVNRLLQQDQIDSTSSKLGRPVLVVASEWDSVETFNSDFEQPKNSIFFPQGYNPKSWLRAYISKPSLGQAVSQWPVMLIQSLSALFGGYLALQQNPDALWLLPLFMNNVWGIGVVGINIESFKNLTTTGNFKRRYFANATNSAAYNTVFAILSVYFGVDSEFVVPLIAFNIISNALIGNFMTTALDGFSVQRENLRLTSGKKDKRGLSQANLERQMIKAVIQNPARILDLMLNTKAMKFSFAALSTLVQVFVTRYCEYLVARAKVDKEFGQSIDISKAKSEARAMRKIIEETKYYFLHPHRLICRLSGNSFCPTKAPFDTEHLIEKRKSLERANKSLEFLLGDNSLRNENKESLDVSADKAASQIPPLLFESYKREQPHKEYSTLAELLIYQSHNIENDPLLKDLQVKTEELKADNPELSRSVIQSTYTIIETLLTALRNRTSFSAEFSTHKELETILDTLSDEERTRVIFETLPERRMLAEVKNLISSLKNIILIYKEHSPSILSQKLGANSLGQTNEYLKYLILWKHQYTVVFRDKQEQITDKFFELFNNDTLGEHYAPEFERALSTSQIHNRIKDDFLSEKALFFRLYDEWQIELNYKISKFRKSYNNLSLESLLKEPKAKAKIVKLLKEEVIAFYAFEDYIDHLKNRWSVKIPEAHWVYENEQSGQNELRAAQRFFDVPKKLPNFLISNTIKKCGEWLLGKTPKQPLINN